MRLFIIATQLLLFETESIWGGWLKHPEYSDTQETTVVCFY